MRPYPSGSDAASLVVPASGAGGGKHGDRLSAPARHQPDLGRRGPQRLPPSSGGVARVQISRPRRSSARAAAISPRRRAGASGATLPRRRARSPWASTIPPSASPTPRRASPSTSRFGPQAWRRKASTKGRRRSGWTDCPASRFASSPWSLVRRRRISNCSRISGRAPYQARPGVPTTSPRPGSSGEVASPAFSAIPPATCTKSRRNSRRTLHRSAPQKEL